MKGDVLPGPAPRPRPGGSLPVSVVIATYNRGPRLRVLLDELEKQTFPSDRFEVVVVDDGGKVPAEEALSGFAPGYAFRLERQANGGAARARQKGAELARGEVLILLDDDMRVCPGFVEAHAREHQRPRGPLDRSPTVVLGRLLAAEEIGSMPLFERFFARMLDEMADGVRKGTHVLSGRDLYTGNVSLPRTLLFDVGGFDPSLRAIEDVELGVRLEKAGARFVFSEGAASVHASDKTETPAWMRRSYNDGVYSARVSKKHADVRDVSPWRFFGELHPVSRPVLAFTVLAPKLAAPIGHAAIATSTALDRFGVRATPRLGLDRLAIAGATFAYGVQYFRGVGDETGGIRDVVRAYREFRRGVRELGAAETRPSGRDAAARAFFEGVQEDHRMTVFYRDKYDARASDEPEGRAGPAELPGTSWKELASGAIQKVGLQIMIAYRVMRFLRDRGSPLGAKLASRLIRHLYASDIHWDAEFAPGVVLVHGFGLAISYAAKVDHGSILFQNVTLGFGIDAVSRATGGPTLEKNVHVGVGATLVGPIVVGEGTKILPHATLMTSVPAQSLVETPLASVRPRTPRA